MKQNNNPLLHQLQLQVEQHVQLAIATIQNLNEDILTYKPNPNAWSIAQCVWHLNSYAAFYHPLFADVVRNSSPKQSYKSGILGRYFINMMLNTSKKLNAHKRHHPPLGIDAHKEVALFIDYQEELLGLIKALEYADLNKRIPISIAPFIRLRIWDVVQFMVAHNQRHMNQINQLI